VKTTILNGALAGDPYTDRVADLAAQELIAQGGQVISWTLREEKVAYCLGCFQCWTKTPGLCRIDDAGRAVTASIIASDLAVYITPITFGGYSSELKKVIDRNICLVSPFFTSIDGEVHHKPRYERYPRLAVVGVLPAPDPEQEELFRRLVERNAINMHTPAYDVNILYRLQPPETYMPGLMTHALNGRVTA
jgi:hypothetical protein